MRCCARVLNHIIKDGLVTIDDGIDKIRESVDFWTTMPKNIKLFKELTKKEGFLGGKKLALDCKTRWNSTYVMLEIVLIYKRSSLD